MTETLSSVIAAGQVGGAIRDVSSSSFLSLFIYLVLIVLSIITWSVIIKKIVDLSIERKRAKHFRQHFLELEGNIVALAQTGILPANSPARLFVSAYEELRLWATLDRSHNSIISEREIVPALERTLDRAIELEKERWERGTTILATIASVSPLLGLLGTVWGIYISFQQMAQMDTASLSTVAPGISEALLTTVAGLLVAIPAVFAHNGILRAVRNIETQLESFSSEIINHFDRQIIVVPPSHASSPSKIGASPRRSHGLS